MGYVSSISYNISLEDYVQIFHHIDFHPSSGLLLSETQGLHTRARMSFLSALLLMHQETLAWKKKASKNPSFGPGKFFGQNHNNLQQHQYNCGYCRADLHLKGGGFGWVCARADSNTKLPSSDVAGSTRHLQISVTHSRAPSQAGGLSSMRSSSIIWVVIFKEEYSSFSSKYT